MQTDLVGSPVPALGSTRFLEVTAARGEEWVWFNYPVPTALHDYSFLGADFRERERIKRKKLRWTNRLRRLDLMERRALLSVIEAEWLSSDPKTPERAMGAGEHRQTERGARSPLSPDRPLGDRPSPDGAVEASER